MTSPKNTHIPIVNESELKITGKTLADRVVETFKKFIDSSVTLSDDIWAKLTEDITTIGRRASGMFVCDIAKSIRNLLLAQVPDMTLSDTERDVLLCDLEIIVSEGYNDKTAPYFYIYVVSYHANKAVGRYIRNYAQFANLNDARKWRDAADDYYDAIYKVKINANGSIHSNFILSIEPLNPIVEQIVSNLTESIDEHEGYANNPDYDELEQHDARVAVEAFQSVLDFVNRITNY